ncbi:hypothetical protein BH10PLA2_BH10PLA2_13950 [soil metagenome]
MRSRFHSLLFLCCLALTGCGTCGDLMCEYPGQEGPFVYRGVRADIKSENYLLYADVPLSAAADTALIPYGCVVMGLAKVFPMPSDQKEYMLPPGEEQPAQPPRVPTRRPPPDQPIIR